MRALIIENNLSYTEMLDHTFAEQGFTNDTGDSIENARSFVDETDYDIICVNQELKDGPGESFVEYCNEHGRQKNTPILFLTENPDVSPENLPVKVDGVIHELNQHQIQDQIIHFVDLHLDHIFFEGRILFVEDNDEVASVILSQLKETGYQVTHFKTADQAWLEFDKVKLYGSHAEAYDLVITEIDLQSGMKGDERVKGIRSFEDGRGFIPIIAITEHNEDQRRISLYHQGFRANITARRGAGNPSTVKSG